MKKEEISKEKVEEAAQEEVSEEVIAEKKEKTLSQRLRYKGKYELLPEKELRKQLRFYERRYLYKYSAYITAIPALFFAILALKYNTLISLMVLLMVTPGILWSILGAFKVRRGGALIIILIGLVLNVIAVIVAAPALVDAIPKIGEVIRLIIEYIQSVLGNSPS